VVLGKFADARRGSRHERGYGSFWDRVRARILKRDSGLCQVCKRLGLITQGNEVDHILPKHLGGTDDDTNLQTICKPCHRAKTQAEATASRGLQTRNSGPAAALAAPFQALDQAATQGGMKSPPPVHSGPDGSPNFCARKIEGWGGYRG
jgi:hypothetical protein